MDSGSAENPFSLKHACQHWVNCRAIWTPHLCRRPLGGGAGGPGAHDALGGSACGHLPAPGTRPTAHYVLSPQLRQRQAARLRAQTLSRAYFHRWGRQVGALEKPPRPAPPGLPPAPAGVTLLPGPPIPANHCPALPASFPGNLSKAKSLPAVSC